MKLNLTADALKKQHIRKTKSFFLSAVAAIGFATTTMAQVPNYVPTNGLAAWYSFTGNANDESGNGNNGTVNGATLTTDRFGDVNKAYNFNGINQNIEVANSNSLNPLEISISVWIYPLTNDICIISKNDPSNATGKSFRLCHQDFWQNQHGLSTRYGTSNCSVQTENGFYGNQGSVTNGAWSHIVTTVSLTGTVKHYLNGTLLETSQSVPMGSCNNPLSTMRIGGLYWTGEQNWFNGKIDEIGIWNRVLTDQEVFTLFNSCQITVTQQPTNQLININSNTQFIAGVTDPNATYQWQTDLGVGFQNLNNVGQYSGTMNDTLNVANVTMSNNNQPFRCIINSGSCSDTSDVAVLTVINNVGLDEVAQDGLFTVYPNPAVNLIQLSVDKNVIGSHFAIEDNSGRTVKEGVITSENTSIELDQLANGNYFIRVDNNGKRSFKVIKN